MKKAILLVTAAVVFFTLMAPPAFAKDNPATKLGRGVANLLTGWVEVPAEISRQLEKKGELAAIFVGPILGLCKAFGRTAVGAYDAFTFPFPLPAEYKPVIEPEFVMENDN